MGILYDRRVFRVRDVRGSGPKVRQRRVWGGGGGGGYGVVFRELSPLHLALTPVVSRGCSLACHYVTRPTVVQRSSVISGGS